MCTLKVGGRVGGLSCHLRPLEYFRCTLKKLEDELESMLIGVFKNVDGCVLDSSKIVYFWRI